MIAGMNLFDAVTQAFATIATGGFSPRNSSIAFYHSVPIEIVVMVFMVLSGLHFGMLYSAVVERRPTLFKAVVARYYLAVMAIGVALTAVLLHGRNYASWADSFRYSSFQIISIGTSTGFANANSSVWPAAAQILLMLFALQCACAGSTSGGIKADRVVMLGKAIARQMRLVQHPRAVIRVWMDGNSVNEAALTSGILYICLYLAVVLVGGMLLTVLLVDAWPVGHPRATSSGESRVIRCGYGGSSFYSSWAWRAVKLWTSWQQR